MHRFFQFPSITMMSGLEGSGLLRHVVFLWFPPFAMASKSKSGRPCTRASLFVGLTLSTSDHYHVEQVEGMRDRSFIFSCSLFQSSSI